MARINKVYPSFYNGISEQSPELILDSQCADMYNCVPDIVQGLTRRPPVEWKFDVNYNGYNTYLTTNVFHTYAREIDDEYYIFMDSGVAIGDITVYNKVGTRVPVYYPSANSQEIRDYLKQGSLRALTVQDTTWIYSTVVPVGTSENPVADAPDYDKAAYMWLKRGSGDRYNPYNYAVYLDGTAYATNPKKPTNLEDDEAGPEDTNVSASLLVDMINNGGDVVEGTHTFSYTSTSTPQTQTEQIYIGSNVGDLTVNAASLGPYTTISHTYDATQGILTLTMEYDHPSPPSLRTFYTTVAYSYVPVPNGGEFFAEVKGSIVKIVRKDGADFDFSTWDSWGSQASHGWKGATNKLTDLPSNIEFEDVWVKITGDGDNEFTDYYVKWNGSSWEETRDPALPRGSLVSMPIICRRQVVDGEYGMYLDLGEWDDVRVGNDENAPDPSIVGQPLRSMFFHKNRLGLVSKDSLALSETANYTNFYPTTVLSVPDTDPIDLTVSTNQASTIHYVVPFNETLYVMTEAAQYELVGENGFTPTSLVLNNISNYPMKTDVEPVVVNDSLFFISISKNKQQLREYIKTENLSVKGVDLNVTTPNLIKEPVVKLIADGVLGVVLCCSETGIVYPYHFKEDGKERIQSAWSRWEILKGNDIVEQDFQYFKLGTGIVIFVKEDNYHVFLDWDLDKDMTGVKCVDATTPNTLPEYTVEYPYESYIELPDYYPQLGNVRTPLNKVSLKKATVSGYGDIDAEIYRKDYDTTYVKSHNLSLKDGDFHINSKVGNCILTVKNNGDYNFKIHSLALEGSFQQTSREMR